MSSVTVPMIFLAAGFVLLVKGADWLVGGSSSLARRFGIPEIVIGLSLVAFGTSMPELVVSLLAGLAGSNEIAFGNVAGSNLFNTLMILGIAALIRPLAVQAGTVKKEIPFSVVITAVLFLLVNEAMLFGAEGDRLSRLDAAVLLAGFAGFLYYLIRLSLKERPQDLNIAVYSGVRTAVYIAGGLAGLVLGGKLVVDSAVSLARVLGMSETFIGLTIVAAGTSLPELATSAVAAARNRADIAVGNVIGSNIFNILFILGISGMVRPMGYNPAMNADLAVLMGVHVLLFIAMFTGMKMKIDRWEGAVLLAVYGGYMVYLLRRG